MTACLVINSGSSSLKYQLIQTQTEQTLASGMIDRIGESLSAVTHSVGGTTVASESPVPDHAAALGVLRENFQLHGPDLVATPPSVIGHRVVHGGSRFAGPTLIDESVVAAIEELSALAPLHNPANLAGILASQRIFPGVAQVAVFDTAFHQSLPSEAYTYAIDRELAERYQVRRYGFHGTSHKYVSERAAAFLNRPLESLKTIVLHLGNGASAAAIDGGRSIDTSMGLTPLQGLVMGTRSGDIDPAVIFHLHRQAGLGMDELDALLNRGSGLLGLTGTGDMRDVQAAALAGAAGAAGAAGEAGAAEAALAVWAHRIRHYIGAYLAQLGGLDAVVFTAGVGENNASLRRRALAGLEFLGIVVDEHRNDLVSREARLISPEGAAVSVLVIPTNEELEIAREAAALLRR